MRSIPVIFLCAGWQSQKEDLKDSWVRFISKNIASDESEEIVKGETFSWNPKATITELNRKLSLARNLVLQNKEAFLVISCAEWASVLEVGKLAPNCYLVPTNIHRFFSSKLGVIQSLLPPKENGDKEGITCVFSSSSLEIPAHLYDISEPVLKFKPRYILDTFLGNPGELPTASSAAAPQFEPDDKTSSLLLFAYLQNEGRLIVATRKANGERGWLSFKHKPYFKIALLENKDVIDQQQQQLPQHPPAKKLKTGVLKAVLNSQPVAHKQICQSPLHSIKFWRLAREHSSETFSRSNMPEELQKGMWLARDAGGGWISTCDSFSGDQTEQKLQQEQRNVQQRVSTVFMISHAHANDFKDMLRPDYCEWERIECFDLWGGPTPNSMRQLGLQCSSRSDAIRSRPKIAYFFIHRTDENFNWGCMTTTDFEEHTIKGDAESLSELQGWMEAHDPDLVAAVGLEGTLDGGHAFGFDRVLKKVSIYEEMRNVIHLESHDLTDLTCLIKAPFQGQKGGRDDYIHGVLKYIKKYDTEKNITEGVIQISYGRGLCNLGDHMGTIKSMNNIYAGWVDKLVSPGIPVSPIRAHVKDKYDGGLVISNDNLTRTSFTRVIDLDFVQEYPTIIIDLDLSPDNRAVLPLLLKARLQDRAILKRDIASLTAADPTSTRLSVLKAKEQSVKLECNAASGWLGRLTPDLARRMTARGQQALEKLASFVSGQKIDVLEGVRNKGDSEEQALRRKINPDSVCSVVYGDTDSIFVEVPEGKDHTFIPKLFRDLRPFLEHQELALTPKRILHGFVPMDGKRYAATRSFDLDGQGNIVPHQAAEGTTFSLQRESDVDNIITSSLPHTTHAFPKAAKDLMNKVVYLISTKRRQIALDLVAGVLREGLKDVPWAGFVCSLKVSSKSADSGMARKLEELREWLASNGLPCPTKKRLIPYVRVILDDGSFSGPFSGDTVAHVPSEIFSTTNRVMLVDINYYVEHFWIRPVGTFLNLSPDELKKLRGAWTDSQMDQPTMVYSPVCLR